MTISVVTHVITESYSKTQARDDRIDYSFQGFDEKHHSDSLKVAGGFDVALPPSGGERAQNQRYVYKIKGTSTNNE